MSKKTSFEHLCSGKTGYSCDESSMARLTKEETWNDLVFKLVTKCETNMIFLPSPTCTVSEFTLDVIPNFSNASLTSTWKACEGQGFDGMNVLGILDANNMPEASTKRYSFGQFINYIVHALEAHFMFQKDYPLFNVNALGLWKDSTWWANGGEAGLKSCAVVLVWKFNRKPIEDVLSRSPLSQLNSSVSRSDGEALTPKVGNKTKSPIVEEIEEKKRKTETTEVKKPGRPSRKSRGRPSKVSPPVSNGDDSTEEDPEISFRKKPEDIIPEVRYLKNMTPVKTPEPVQPMETDACTPKAISLEDLTLGFEKKAQPSNGGRKSTARKSLLPDWPNTEKELILEFYDNLNPSKAEQTRVALTCKFAQMQYSRELPSKLLYQWIQKKGRPINRTITSFEIPEDEQNKAMLSLYNDLNPETSDVSRIAFICKFVNMQYDISLTPREFNDLLNGKVKKTPKKRR
ncbi:uncharacterized protein [Palaemon carinicauda]|uniref:uncharacterized protein n=1 Tax=Palaemon carinicauda TaxID=392227 RepID=UPI0035B5A6D2